MNIELDDPRLPARFWSKVIPEPNTGCWLWLASTTSHGYGYYWTGVRVVGAHKAAYEALVGPVPDGLVLDHRRCDTPTCCNPRHLVPTTIGANLARASNYRGGRTHCPAGHEYTPENTHVDPRTKFRYCRACGRVSKMRSYYARKKP